MSIIRQDLATKDWTIFSAKRGLRPNAFSRVKDKKVSSPYEPDCPFCRGNEHMTPAGLLSVGSGDDWSVRVVPNKFPAVEPREDKDLTINRHISGPYLSIDGIGSHEVIIETPKHNGNMANASPGQVEKVMGVYRKRFIELSENPDFQLVLIFKNHGIRAGTSLEHPHSQLVATPFVPGFVRNKFYESQRYYDDFGRCVYCDTINFELKAKERIVYLNEKYVAIAPYASVVPYNVVIYPLAHQSCFAQVDQSELSDMAHILQMILKKLYNLLDDPDYNYILDSTPMDQCGSRHYHWHLEILPRLSTRAGFEIGSGMNINSTFPEDCAKRLREQKI